MSFKFDQLINGAGSAIPTDSSDPNTAAPPEARVQALAQFAPSLRPAPLQRFTFWPLDGTTISVVIWVKEAATGTWVKYANAALVVAASAAPVASLAGGVALPAGAEVFMQVTANTGVTLLGWRFG